MKYTVKELAAKVDGQVIGDDKAVIEETRGLTQATAHSISFAVGEFLDHLAEVKTAGAVVVEKAVPEAAPWPLLSGSDCLIQNPHLWRSVLS